MKNILFRILKNKNTTIGGGVLGVVVASIFAKLEEMSGCKFSVAFANIDWGQLFIFGIMQLFGAFVTDADKIVEKQNTPE